MKNTGPYLQGIKMVNRTNTPRRIRFFMFFPLLFKSEDSQMWLKSNLFLYLSVFKDTEDLSYYTSG